MHPNSARGPRSQSGLRAHQLLHRRGMALDALPGHLQPLQRRATPGNRLRGKINQQAKDKAYLHGVVSVEVNAHETSQYCSRCGAKGEGFSYKSGRRFPVKWGKLFICPMCHYEANAYFNASVNVHHSFYREWHWQPRTARVPPPSPEENGT